MKKRCMLNPKLSIEEAVRHLQEYNVRDQWSSVGSCNIAPSGNDQSESRGSNGAERVFEYERYECESRCESGTVSDW